MRIALIVLAVVVTAVVGRFLWDDVVSGEDVPRGVHVAGVDIGDRDRAEAATRLAALTADREVTLRFAEGDRTDTLSAWGVVLDVEATLDEAERTRGGGPVRFLRWMAAVVRDRDVAPRWTVDRSVLSAAISAADVDVALADTAVVLSGGRFVAAAGPDVPVIDMDALAGALLEAVRDDGPDGAGEVEVIEVPLAGTRSTDGDPALAEALNDLTDDGLRLVMAGRLEESVTVPTSSLRRWIDLDGLTTIDGASFTEDAVEDWIAGQYPDLAEGDGVRITAGFGDRAYVIGALPGAECCAADTAARLMAALRGEAEQPVTVFPLEPADARGLAWASGLGIEEMVAEFTTFFRPGQTRNVNIARIAELTRGAVIEPGETFSVNDYVGRRTTENGFVAAGVISNGVFSTSVGGGISQYATTLFNAAFFAGLDFGEYQSHSIYIDRYPYGREATVSFPAPDLQIRNTTPYGVMIWPTTTEDSITVRLYSTPWAQGEQTGQVSRREGVACTRVVTERTRTYTDGRTEVDTVTARYRPEGIDCSGRSTRPTTTTEAPPTSSSEPSPTTSPSGGPTTTIPTTVP